MIPYVSGFFVIFVLTVEFSYYLLITSLRSPGGGTPYNGLYEEAPSERGTSFRLEVYKREGISRVEVQKRVGKIAAWAPCSLEHVIRQTRDTGDK